MTLRLPVLVHTPAHSQMAGPLTYLSAQALAAGTLVRVPLGKRELLGVVWDSPTDPASSTLDPEKLRPLVGTLDGIAPLTLAWRQLVMFAASYYQRSVGEVALAALPPQLRDLNTVQLARRLKRHAKAAGSDLPTSQVAMDPVALTEEQTKVIAAYDRETGPFTVWRDRQRQDRGLFAQRPAVAGQ